MMRILLLLCCSLVIGNCLFAQHVYQPLADQAIYDFMDELANDQLIVLPTVAKPYPRTVIAEKLRSVVKNELANDRQRKRAEILLTDYNFEDPELELGSSFRDAYSIVPPRVRLGGEWGKVMARPIYGIQLYNTGEDSFFASYGGAEMMAYLGRGFSAYANIRDNYQQEILGESTFLTRETGAAYKYGGLGGRVGADFSEFRGGITYSWDWGTVGFVKDQVQWGNHYGGANILSGRAPSFPMVNLELKPFKWLQFRYFHAWLVSEVIDSTRSYTYTTPSSSRFRAVYRNKHIAANLFTISPWSTLDVSFGNSIVYSDMPAHPAYFIPFAFFKAVDHTINQGIDNQNSQLFFDISYRGIKHLHLFSSVFVDELSFTRLFDPDRRNFLSYKFGVGLSNWPFENVGLQLDYNRTTPVTYDHRIPSLTYASNEYNLGHFLNDNAASLNLQLWVRPHAKWNINFAYDLWQQGEQFPYDLLGDTPVDELPFLDNIMWESSALSADISWVPISNFSAFIQLVYRNTESSLDTGVELLRPAFEANSDFTGGFGFRFGFK